MISCSKVDKGYKYLLTVINTFSKCAYVVQLKSVGKNVAAALQPILAATHNIMYLQTDHKEEYYNKIVQAMLHK